jgi:PAS domain S-box-containing protein
LEKFIEVAKTGESAEFEHWYDGEGMRNWFRFTVNKVGKLLVVTTEDITKRKQAEEAIHDNEERLSNIINQVNAGIAQTTIQGRFTDANERFLQITGYTKEELLEQTIENITHPHDWPRNKELFVKALTEGKNFFIEKRYIRKEGSIVWVNNSVSIVTDNKGEKFITAVSLDITEQITSRQKLEESEERFRSMADASPLMIWTLHENGNSTYYNSRAREFTGHTKEDLEGGKSWQVAIHPDDIEYAGGVVQNAVINRIPYEMECRMQRADGEWRWLLNHGTPRFGKAGEYFGFVGSSIDITEQKKAQQELQTALEQIRLSKEAAELGTFDMDLEKGTMHWDDRCRMLFGISHHDTVTYENDFITGLHPDDRDRITKIIGQLLDRSTSNGDYDVEYRTVGAEDGVLRWVRAKGKVYFNKQDKPLRFIGSVLDITEKVLAIQRIEVLVEERTQELAHANQALQNINKELQRSNQSLEEFAHAASHDLKEPIRKIHFFTTQVKSQIGERLDESTLRSFGRIENAAQRMSLLIDDLLLYSHVRHQPHHMESIDLNLKLKNVMEDLELDIEKKKADIQVQQLPVVNGYRRQLEQLFQNLISNALKYSKADVPPIIKIEAQEVQKAGKAYHLISVKDNGIGFAQEYAEKIFQMFTRLHGKAEYSGTGVGLAIVKKVVENHNGYIEVESVVNEGTVFKIYLPA